VVLYAVPGRAPEQRVPDAAAAPPHGVGRMSQRELARDRDIKALVPIPQTARLVAPAARPRFAPPVTMVWAPSVWYASFSVPSVCR